MTDADGNDDGESRDNGGRPSLAERRETPDVYQPAEDSHLLATAAREEVGAGSAPSTSALGQDTSPAHSPTRARTSSPPTSIQSRVSASP